MSRTKKIIVFLIAAAIPFWVLWRIALVSFDHSSLGDPLSGVKITSQKINDQTAFILPEEKNYFFDRIKLRLNFNQNPTNSNNNQIKIKAYQNFPLVFYPKNEQEINGNELNNLIFKDNDTDVPIGGMFSTHTAVNIMLPNNSYMSVFSAELFEKRNYKWEDIFKKSTDFVNKLEFKGSWNFGQPYPDGTVVTNQSKNFLIWNKRLLPIESGVDIKKYTGASPVKIDNLEPKAFAECETSIIKKYLECTFDNPVQSQKSKYIFIISGLDESDEKNIGEVKLKLSTTPKSKSVTNNIEVSISDIKLKLIKKYRGYIPFI